MWQVASKRWPVIGVAGRNNHLLLATCYLLLLIIALIIAFIPAPYLSISPTARHVHLAATSFAYAPSVITVNPGDHVTLELTAGDVVHGLYLDGYDLNLVAEPGQTQTLTFIADKPGTFRFRCSVTCGPLHPFMIGKLIVGVNWLFYRALGLAGLAVIAGLLLVTPHAPLSIAKHPFGTPHTSHL